MVVGAAFTDTDNNGRVGDEISLRLPTSSRRLRILELVTVHQAEGTGISGDR